MRQHLGCVVRSFAVALLHFIGCAEGDTDHLTGESAIPPRAPEDAGLSSDAAATAPQAAACDVSAFDPEVFRTDIEPILLGKVDYNDRRATPGAKRCAAASCHGTLGGNALSIVPGATAENLARFACFVDGAAPRSSRLLLCAIGDPACRKGKGHPGGAVFEKRRDDRNYGRILSYLYTAKGVSSPFDLAFFAKRINTLFDKTLAGEAATTCAAADCHGGASPRLRLLPDVGLDKKNLLRNYEAAVKFVDHLNPAGGDLFLYPTNESANPRNPLATNRAHTGGRVFAATSAEARAVVAWSRGLAPTADGFVTSFLVAGPYAGALDGGTAAGDEAALAPSFLDTSQTPGGWNASFAQSEDETAVDLGAVVSAREDEIAFAVAYLVNRSDAPIDAVATIASSAPFVAYVAGQRLVQANGAPGGAPISATLPPFGADHKRTRLLVKVQRRADRFDLRVNLTRTSSLALTGRDVLVSLDPNGGV